MIRPATILAPLLAAWCTHAFAEYAAPPPPKIYKCVENGVTWYQEDLCPAGPSKAIKQRDAKGIEAPKKGASVPEYVPPGPAPVAVIPHTPSKPIGRTGVAKEPAPCRSVGGPCP